MKLDQLKMRTSRTLNFKSGGVRTDIKHTTFKSESKQIIFSTHAARIQPSIIGPAWGPLSKSFKYLPALRGILHHALQGTLREPEGGWMLVFTDDPIEMEREYREWVVQYTRPGSSWR